MISLISLILVIIGTLIGSIGAVLLKKASKYFSFSKKGILRKELIIALIAYGVSTIIFIIALKFGELSVLYSFVSLTYIWVEIASKRLLKEKITKYKIIGIILIIVGVSLIGFGS